MIYPWMFDEVERLRPLKEAADRLAEKGDWAPLYDVARLRENEVPVAAAVYYDDMYVERGFSLENRGDDPRDARVDHERARAQRSPRRRRQSPRPPPRHAAR